ncbi:MAG: succinate dehydrogenase [Planctomycetes bacterium]|nr:succinate dehydrogenase [Planctomycetota bacterium]
MSQTVLEPGGHQSCLGCTRRQDSWWAGPTATVATILAFIIYSTWAAFQGEHYYAEPYLSPFYSPLLLIKPDVAGGAPLDHAWFAGWPEWIPAFVTPAFFILIFPGAFRFTCYYYRKAYYRSFVASPPGCAVGARMPGTYDGERRLLAFQNLHRYALYFALGFIVVLTWDALIAFMKYNPATDRREFGVGVGTLVLCLNTTLLACFTFGCNSFRHLVGGNVNAYSKHPVRFKLWSWVTVLNRRHMEFAWLSLFSVGLTDLYVRLVSMGIITDYNTWGF